jgi:predicted N-acetyltransferase YhbS
MPLKMPIEIKFLIDCQEYTPLLAELWYQEISRHWVPDASIEKAKDRLVAHLHKDKMPLALVAFSAGQPVGMACLRETDGIRPGIAPWLGSLVVHPEFRGYKIGETLIEAIKIQARLLNYKNLYLLAFDQTIPNWYEKLGWHLIGDDQLLGHRVAVMEIAI